MMGKRGSKPKFTDVSCPNQDCKFYGISRKGNVIGNGTCQIKNKRIRKYICRIHGRVFNDLTNTFFDNIRKDESIVKLALKIAIKEQYVTDELIESTDKHLLDSKPLFVTDGLKFYAGFLLKK